MSAARSALPIHSPRGGRPSTGSGYEHPAAARTPGQDSRHDDVLAQMSRARLLAEVRSLRTRVERQDIALEHAGRAIVTLRRGVEALLADNRELTMQVHRDDRSS